MAYHAKLSPSSADRWTSCTASVDAQEGIKDDGSEAARDGTACHQMSAEILQHGFDAQSYLGRKMLFWVQPDHDINGEDWVEAFGVDLDAYAARNDIKFVHEVVITQDMVDAVIAGTNFVLQILETTGGRLEVEQKVPVGHFTGEVKRWVDSMTGMECQEGDEFAEPEWATGTSDVVIMTEDTIHVIDFKYGRVKVQAYDVLVPAREDFVSGKMIPEVLRANLQMTCYAAGSYKKFKHLFNFKRVTMTIVQPFMQHVSEYSCDIEEMLALQDWLAMKAEETRSNPVFAPSGDACHFCKKSGNCAAQTQAVLSTALIGFDDVTEAQPRPIVINQLGSLYDAIPMISEWCKAVENRTYERLLDGHPVVRNDGMHYKLVAGRKGQRSWRDPAVAEATMKRMRLKREQMYSELLASPAVIEKLAAVKKPKKGQPAIPPVIGATQWSRLEELIHQNDGSPTVALETDPRPAIAKASDGFEDVATPQTLQSCDDLFA